MAVRLFVGLWPPADVSDLLARLPRPPHPSVRWTTPPQWHVTLRFLGEVPEGEVAGLRRALEGVGASHPPREVRAGPSTARLGRGTLMVPVTGVDDLGDAVRAATSDVGRPPEPRPFTGHLTVARGKGRRPVPAELTGAPFDAGWLVEDLALVRSRLHPDGARYDTVLRVALTGAGPPPAASGHDRT